MFVLCAKPAVYDALHRRYMLGRSACQHTWLIVMCGISYNRVSFMFPLSVSILLVARFGMIRFRVQGLESVQHDIWS